MLHRIKNLFRWIAVIFTPVDPTTAYLSRAADLADLERRIRYVERHGSKTDLLRAMYVHGA